MILEARMNKAAYQVPAQRFAVSACLRSTGERVSPVFWFLAKTEWTALTRARALIAKGGGYDPASVSVRSGDNINQLEQ
jgi:hypothetical protein